MNTNEMIAWGVLGLYLIMDIIKHIITLSFKLLQKQIDKEEK